jgi:uncharacterized protein (TIGR03435 family)
MALLRNSWVVQAWLLGSVLAYGQQRSPEFEVVSVKPSPPVSPDGRVFLGPPQGGPGTTNPGQIRWTYTTIRSLLMTAYDVKAYQVSGPAWISTERYDVIAKVPAGTTRAQLGAMWQHLLADRFGLVLHHSSKEFQVEELTVAKGGSKLKESSDDPDAPPADGPPTMTASGDLAAPGLISMFSRGPSAKARTIARAQPIAKLTELLTNQLGHPVLDKTGLNGRYDFSLEYTPRRLPQPETAGPDSAAMPAGDPEFDIAAVLPQQLGLRLVAAKANLDVLVIDKVEKTPVAN